MSNPNRRTFLAQSALAAGAASLPLVWGQNASAWPRPQENKISVAIWSLIRSFRAGTWELTDLARICREELSVDGIEYVNRPFFEVPVSTYLNRLNRAADDNGIENVLIMVDGEGSLVAYDQAEREQAVINHRKWIDIAAYMGCHAIRCNAHGGGDSLEEDPDSIKRAAEAFNALLEYARPSQVNVIIENHGGLSSQPGWLAKLAQEIDSEHFGLLPDYGNFPGDIDRYQAIEEMMPYAKGVSVKASWQPGRSHPRWDLERLINISLDSGYSGYWGIESSMADYGASPSPEKIKQLDGQAVIWTREVIEKTVLNK